MGFLRRFHPTNVVGNRGEDEAVSFLRASGYRILERNYRNNRGRALGEIDIIARDSDDLVFVEVKTRTAKAGFPEPLPEESITREKLRRLMRIAQGYLREKRLESAPYRFDAVLIVYRDDIQKPEIRHFKSIFL
ncbi:MAG: YraN family protein [Candidatus Moraniibacteriota bacterium]